MALSHDDEPEGFEPDEPEFCIVHGYEHMKTDRGPIAYCAECERDNSQFGVGA